MKNELQADLLTWFERNQRDLPWRQNRDPYKVWVSEIMLQQTRVDTVIPYFENFISRFPTVHELAYANEEEVLKAWEGLGYYSRVRNLQSAVREVVEQYGGVVPDTEEEVSRLKGVGPYTAGAILSIAYGKRVPAVDGNVMRVISRLFNLHDDIAKVSTRKNIERIVRDLIPEGSASFFNQALMELGALICTPRSPKCLHCPVEEHCSARQAGVEEELPIKTKAKKPRPIQLEAAVIQRDGKVLIRKRPMEGLLAGLWEFPGTEQIKDGRESESIAYHLYTELGVQTGPMSKLMEVQHVFSHLIWNIDVYTCSWSSGECSRETAKWVDIDALQDYAFPVAHQKILKEWLVTIGRV